MWALAAPLATKPCDCFAGANSVKLAGMERPPAPTLEQLRHGTPWCSGCLTHRRHAPTGAVLHVQPQGRGPTAPELTASTSIGSRSRYAASRLGASAK